MVFSPEISNKTERPSRHSQSTRTLGAFSLGCDRARIISNPREGEFAFFYAPGWHTDGETIARNFDKHTEQLGSTHYGVHPERRYSLDSQKEEWLKARKNDGYRPAKIYAPSMGALTVSHAFADERFRYDFGEVDSLCFDSPVSSKNDVRRLARIGMRFGMTLPISRICEKINQAIMQQSLSKDFDFDKNSVTIEEAYENSAASALTGFEACKTQLQAMHALDTATLDLSKFGRSVPNKKIISAVHDNLINVTQSATVINKSYGGGFEHWYDTTRKYGDHATGTERPQGVIDALMNQNSDRYRVVSIL